MTSAYSVTRLIWMSNKSDISLFWSNVSDCFHDRLIEVYTLGVVCHRRRVGCTSRHLSVSVTVSPAHWSKYFFRCCCWPSATSASSELYVAHIACRYIVQYRTLLLRDAHRVACCKTLSAAPYVVWRPHYAFYDLRTRPWLENEKPNWRRDCPCRVTQGPCSFDVSNVGSVRSVRETHLPQR